MKNITVTIHDETYLSARIYAAQQSTSVSALVRHFLESLDERACSVPYIPDEDLDPSGTPPPPLFTVRL
jgi:hypothetical protein